MGTPANFTQFDAFMKELYADWQVPYSAIKKSPLLAAINHDKNAHGNHQVVPAEYGNGGGRSANFATAQSNTQGAANAKFLVTWTNDYAVAQFNGDIADFSQGEGAIVDIVTREIESKKQKLMNSLCASLYGDGSGKIGQSSTSDPVGANYITLTNKYDVTKVKVNDSIDTFAPGATSVRTGTAVVTSIDRANGVLYFAGGVTGSIPGYTTGDYICIDGDFNSKLVGLAWT